MLNIFSNLFLNSLIGLAIILIVSLINFIKMRHRTTPVIISYQFFFSLISIILFGWPCIIYAIILSAAILSKKLYDIYNGGRAPLDYSSTIHSFSRIKNLLKTNNKNEIIVGNVVPVNRYGIKNNMRAVVASDQALSGGTLVTGSTGSGKNLHIDTIIPTINGFKTIKTIKEGDIIFDKNGKPSKVLAKYCPKETKFYELTFSDGTKVKCGGGHLWEVIDSYRGKEKVGEKSFSDLFNDVIIENLYHLSKKENKEITLNEFVDIIAASEFNTIAKKRFNRFIVRYFSEYVYKLEEIDEINLLKVYDCIKDSKNIYRQQKALNIEKYIKENNKVLISRKVFENLVGTKYGAYLKLANIKLPNKAHLLCESKILSKKIFNFYKQYCQDTPIETIYNTKQMYSLNLSSLLKTGIKRFAITRPEPCNYEKISLPIKPYWLGAWLGDGSKYNASICGTDLEVGHRLNKDYKIKKTKESAPRKKGYLPVLSWNFDFEVTKLLRKYNLNENKHLPEVYKLASVEDKLELIAGLIDTDGYVDDLGEVIIKLTNRQIIESIRTIVCSLGWKCSPIVEQRGSYTNQHHHKIFCKMVYAIVFHPTQMIPIQVKRKREALLNKLNKVKNNEVLQQVKHRKFFIESIEEIEDTYENYYCLGIDSETHVFLCTESYIPTHNTSTIKSMIYQALDKKHQPITFFDFKGQTDILDDIEEICTSLNIPYYEFSSRKCNFHYDPLVNLDATGKVEAILNTRRWSTTGADDHYRSSMQLAAQNLIEAYDEYRERNNDNSNYMLGLYNFCPKYHPNQNDRDGYNTIQKMLEILLSSRAKDLLNDNNGEEFSFQRDDCYVICFSFVSANKALASSLSSFIFQDLMDRGTKRPYRPKMLLGVDEFGTLENSSIIKDILEKGRSGGIQTIFSILDINQVASNTSMYFVNAILGTINNYIFHNGATKQTAEILSGVQRQQLEGDIMNLKKPINGEPPTALYISKYPIFEKGGANEFYKIIPYSYSAFSSTKEIKKDDNEEESGLNLGIEETEDKIEVLPNKNKIIEMSELDEYL